MAGVNLRLSRPALRQILSGNGNTLEAALSDEAQRIRSAASAEHVMVGDTDGGPRERPIPIRVESSGGSFGARAAVILAHPAGIAVEAKHRLLGRNA